MDDVRFWTDGVSNPDMQWAVHSDGRVLVRFRHTCSPEWEQWSDSGCTSDMFDPNHHAELSVSMVAGGNPFEREA